MRPERRAIAAWRRFVYEDFVALHGAVQLVGRDEEIVVAVGASVGADEAVAVAMQVEPAGEEAVARGSHGLVARVVRFASGWAGGLLEGGGGESPLLELGLHEFAACGDAGQLFEQEAAFAASAQAKFADELLVSSAMAGRALDAPDQFTVGLRIRSLRHLVPRIPRCIVRRVNSLMHVDAAYRLRVGLPPPAACTGSFSNSMPCSSVVPAALR